VAKNLLIMKKTILLLAFLGAVTMSASAQNPVNPVRKKTVVITECSNTATNPVSYQTDNSSETGDVLDIIQKQSENTVIYPLVRMAQMVRAKIETMKHQKHHHIIIIRKTVNSNKTTL
jgi:hypothetical protein